MTRFPFQRSQVELDNNEGLSWKARKQLSRCWSRLLGNVCRLAACLSNHALPLSTGICNFVDKDSQEVGRELTR